ncbi:hypothetical protein BH23THE1_BH23THE1_31720 [soil metagenome]
MDWGLCLNKKGLDADSEDIENKDNFSSIKPTIDRFKKESTKSRSEFKSLIEKKRISTATRTEQSYNDQSDSKQAEGNQESDESKILVENNDNDLAKVEISNINNKPSDSGFKLIRLNEGLIQLVDNLFKKYVKQKEFIDVAAHELRSPSQAIIGYIDLLELGPGDNKKYLSLISSNAERLNVLISNILYASRIDNQIMTIKKENLIWLSRCVI